MDNPLVIIDGNNQIYRSEWKTGLYYKNQRVSGILTFLKKIKRIINEQTKPDNVIVCWDSYSKRKREEYPDYKAGRVKGKYYHELLSEMEILSKMLKSLGIKQFKIEGYEADELIADLVYNANNRKKIIMTTDADMYQLLDNSTSIVGSGKVTVNLLKKKMGMTPEEHLFSKIVCGDSSDNIPGIYGIGLKRYLSFLRESDSIEHMLEYHPKVKRHIDIIKRNFKLIKLDRLNLKQTRKLVIQKLYPDIDEFRKLCYKYGLFSVIKNFQNFVEKFRRTRYSRREV